MAEPLLSVYIGLAEESAAGIRECCDVGYARVRVDVDHALRPYQSVEFGPFVEECEIVGAFAVLTADAPTPEPLEFEMLRIGRTSLLPGDPLLIPTIREDAP